MHMTLCMYLERGSLYQRSVYSCSCLAVSKQQQTTNVKTIRSTHGRNHLICSMRSLKFSMYVERNETPDEGGWSGMET